MKLLKRALAGASIMLACTVAIAVAEDAAKTEDDYSVFLSKYISEQMKAALLAPEVIAAIQAQNAANATLTEAGIDALDRQWRAEAKTFGGALVNATMSNEASAFLRGFKAASGGVIAEIFIMDNKGLNVAQTDPTSDYMQGDEDKWQKTYAVGPWRTFTDAPEEGVVQVSLTAVDADKPIGAMTVGINIDKLPRE